MGCLWQDIYACGLVLYALLTGHRRWDVEQPFSSLMLGLNGHMHVRVRGLYVAALTTRVCNLKQRLPFHSTAGHVLHATVDIAMALHSQARCCADLGLRIPMRRRRR